MELANAANDSVKIIVQERSEFLAILFTLLSVILVLAIFYLLYKYFFTKKEPVFTYHTKHVDYKSDSPLKIRTHHKPLTTSKDQKNNIKKLVEKKIQEHLKADEREIVNILKARGGSCEQGTLVFASGYSKAKVSELIKELAEREIVFKKEKGKKNIIFLK